MVFIKHLLAQKIPKKASVGWLRVHTCIHTERIRSTGVSSKDFPLPNQGKQDIPKDTGGYG